MREPLYFRRFELTEVHVPSHEEMIIQEDGKTPSWNDVTIVMVEGHLSNGLTALGELGRGQTLEDAKKFLQLLAGRDLFQTPPATHWRRNEGLPGHLPLLFPQMSWEVIDGNAFVLLECLILDALGKTLGLPLHFFWGGRQVDRVPVDFWFWRPPAKEAKQLARRAVKDGFRGIKTKAILNEGIIDTCRAMREEVGRAFRITIDPMCAWRSFTESAFIFEALARMDGYWQIEDPFAHSSIDCWKQARARFGLPLIWHARSMELARTGFQLGVADGFNLGGAGSDFVYVARAAQFLGLSCWHGTALEMGVRQHFHLHSTAAVGNATLGNDLQSEFVRKSTLVTPHMEIRDGFATVPDRPGLGVELDRAELDKYAVARETLSLE